MSQPESLERELTVTRELLRHALPMLEQLGDFIGNGELDPKNADSLGERCDLILKIKKALNWEVFQCKSYRRTPPQSQLIELLIEALPYVDDGDKTIDDRFKGILGRKMRKAISSAEVRP